MRNAAPAFDVLSDPIRRRLLELLAVEEQTSGAMTLVAQAEFGITQSAVSQHLKVLRDSGLATVRPDGARRIYAVAAEPLGQVDAWLAPFRAYLRPQRGTTAMTEPARGKKKRGGEPVATDELQLEMF